MKLSTIGVLSLVFFPILSWSDVTLKNSSCENSLKTEGPFFKIESTCKCLGKVGTGEFKGKNFNLVKSTAEARARDNLANQFIGQTLIDCNGTSVETKTEVKEKPISNLPSKEIIKVESSTKKDPPKLATEGELNQRIRAQCPNGIRESKQKDGRTYLFCNNSKDTPGPLKDENGNFIIQGENGLETFNRSGKEQPVEAERVIPQESPKKETSILELIRSCKEPTLNKESCRELTEINPKFADMILQLNEKFRNRNALKPEGVDAHNLAQRDNYEMAIKLLDLEYQDEKKIFESFCEDESKKALCLTDIDMNNLENHQKMEKCLIQRLSNIQMKNPKALKENNSVFAMKHMDLWEKNGKDCNKLISQDEKNYQLEKFYDSKLKLRDFDPATCQWFSDLPRRIVRGEMKSCTKGQRSQACVGYVVCENKQDGSKFIRQSTCSKDNCTNERAVACTVEKNYSSMDYVPKNKDVKEKASSGAQQQ